MAKGIYTAIGSSTKKVKKLYGVIGGVTRKIKKAYAVIDGKTRLIWSGNPITAMMLSSTEVAVSEDNGNTFTTKTISGITAAQTTFTSYNGTFYMVSYNKYATKNQPITFDIYTSSDAVTWNLLKTVETTATAPLGTTFLYQQSLLFSNNRAVFALDYTNSDYSDGLVIVVSSGTDLSTATWTTYRYTGDNSTHASRLRYYNGYFLMGCGDAYAYINDSTGECTLVENISSLGEDIVYAFDYIHIAHTTSTLKRYRFGSNSTYGYEEIEADSLLYAKNKIYASTSDGLYVSSNGSDYTLLFTTGYVENNGVLTEVDGRIFYYFSPSSTLSFLYTSDDGTNFTLRQTYSTRYLPSLVTTAS